MPFLDRLGPPVTSTFRPQEALSTQVLNAAIRAHERRAARRRAPHRRPASTAPSATSSTQLLDGRARRRRSTPTAARAGYRGVQAASNPDGVLLPPRPRRAAPARAARAARSGRSSPPGCARRGTPRSATTTCSSRASSRRRTRIDAIATGGRALLTFDPALARPARATLPRDAGRGGDSPDLRDVPRDAIDDAARRRRARATTTDGAGRPARRHLRGDEPVAAPARAPPACRRRRRAPGLRRRPRPGRARDRARHRRRGRAAPAASLEPAQVAFLRARARRRRRPRDRRRRPPRPATAPRGGDRGARAARPTTRASSPSSPATRTATRSAPVRTRAGGYWRITTSSLADWPQQGRMLRLVTGPAARARSRRGWSTTPAASTARDLAGAARELAYLDAQGGRPDRAARARAATATSRLWLPQTPKGVRPLYLRADPTVPGVLLAEIALSRVLQKPKGV